MGLIGDRLGFEQGLNWEMSLVLVSRSSLKDYLCKCWLFEVVYGGLIV